ncbi:MAG: hypothetical protein CEN91_10 [Candidatus Berkelbacteria bacterium Licking1014_85]|uniref:Uncharacterized protein n=1 Tax=Candidatus Berkelbacteria bacterium Licking1014_85 TaxID=2017148 RepID=A0A554LNI3_9BACT|nr:MAG: hypothetical protein CEN91_10 [Candidatus Berkelbacteria bacterium Licking1014_85]
MPKDNKGCIVVIDKKAWPISTQYSGQAPVHYRTYKRFLLERKRFGNINYIVMGEELFSEKGKVWRNYISQGTRIVVTEVPSNMTDEQLTNFLSKLKKKHLFDEPNSLIPSD